MKTPIDRLAEKLEINPDIYSASDCEQAILLAVEVGDLTLQQILTAVDIEFRKPSPQDQKAREQSNQLASWGVKSTVKSRYGGGK